jgi:hypothetical protein
VSDYRRQPSFRAIPDGDFTPWKGQAMNLHLRRFVMLCTAGLIMLAAGLSPAQAANNRASCVGIIVSTEAPAGVLDVGNYKAIAEEVGAKNFGEFVAEGAHRHDASVEKCLEE